MDKKKDYVETIYDEKRRPKTLYPSKLTKYLCDRFELKKNKKLLDVGCGRGEFLKGFKDCGLNVFGVDGSSSLKEILAEEKIKICNFEKGILPYEENSFDYIFSKSVIEHFYYPEKLVAAMYKVLKPGGKIIVLTPDWESIYKIFYEDYTHRTPFTLSSLRDIQELCGFKNIKVEKFYQLPIIWKIPILKIVSKIMSITCPWFLAKQNKFIRFSKELMLLSVAKK